MTGQLNTITPTSGDNATNKTYVDGTIDSKIDSALTGDVVGGTGITVSDNTPASGQITVAVTAGSIGATQLASTAVTAGTYGASQSGVPSFTVDADGRLTAASTDTSPSFSGNVTTTAGFFANPTSDKGFQIRESPYSSNDATVTLFTDGSATFEGNVTLNANLDMQDNDKILLGAGDDLEIYHDGTNSYIDNNTNSVFIRSNVDDDDGGNIFIQAKSGENSILCNDDGAVQIYYDNSEKLATKSDGIDVTGEVQCDSLDVDGSADISSDLVLRGELNLMGDSDANKFIDARLGSGTLNIRGTSGGDANHETMAQFTRNGAVSLYHDNSKKFETTSAGATVTGTLTVNTPTADSHAATKAYVDNNAGGGGTLTATASGALTNGATVIVNSDGTVSVVSGTVTSTGLGTEAAFESGNTEDIAAVYCPDADKVVVAYKDVGDSNKGKAVLGTISSGNITFGSPVEFDSGAGGISMAYDELADRVVIHYKDTANSDKMTLVVGNPNGSNITFGSPNTYYNATGGGNRTGMVYDSNAQRCFGCWANGTAETRGIVVKTDSNSVSVSGTEQVVSGTGVWLSTAFDASVNKIVIAYQDDDDNDRGHIVICTVTASDSNGSMSFGGETEFESGTTTYIAAAYDANAQKTVIAYVDASDSNKGKALAVSVNSSSVVTKDTIGEFEAGSTAHVSAAYNPDDQNVTIFYRDSDNSNRLQSVEATVNGSNLDFGTAVQLTTDAGDQTALCYSTTDDVFVAAFRDGGNSNQGTGATLSMGATSTNLTAENYIGISDGAYANGATATIQIVGSVDDAQSSLTPGQAYYVQLDGTLGTTPASTSVFAGTAVSATQLIVKG
jgi:hypothetical protein